MERDFELLQAELKASNWLLQESDKALVKICQALGVDVDWHAEPFPHLEEVLAAIEKLRRGELASYQEGGSTASP